MLKPFAASVDSAPRPTGAALFLSAEAPYPCMGGGALRSASLLEYLAGRYDVDVIVFRQPGAPDPGDAFPPGLARRVFSIDLPFHSRRPAARTLRVLSRFLRNRPPLIDRFSGFASSISACLEGRDYDLAVVEHIWCAEYVAAIRPHSRCVLLDVHNIESLWHARLAAAEKPLHSLVLKRFAAACRAFERHWLPQYDALLVTSDADAKLLDGGCTIVYPNALPLRPRPAADPQQAIVFTGNLEYRPNLSAVAYFKEKIWPILRRRVPNLVWRIAGSNSAALSSVVNGDPRVHVTGCMPDAIATIAAAKVAVVPLLAGSGTRFKILEAWAAGTPVVSTSIGAEGLRYNRGEHLLIADDPEEFAEAVAFLLDAPEARAQLAAAGRRLYENCYTWNVAWEVLNRELPRLTQTVAEK